MIWSDGAIPCQVPGHEHVAAASIYETENHATALELLEKGKAAIARRKTTVPGICSKCGCTDDFGCDVGCSWTDARHTLCSSCAAPSKRGRR